MFAPATAAPTQDTSTQAQERRRSPQGRQRTYHHSDVVNFYSIKDLQSKIEHLKRDNSTLYYSKPEFISTYSDASLKPNHTNTTFQSGWGVWIRDSDQSIHRSGPGPSWAIKIQQVELCAVYVAIYSALSFFNTAEANILVVKTDCHATAQFFGWHRGRRLPKCYRSCLLILWALEQCKLAGLKLVVKWVKGHQKDNTLEGYLNHQVDRLAKQGRKGSKPIFIHQKF